MFLLFPQGLPEVGKVPNCKGTKGIVQNRLLIAVVYRCYLQELREMSVTSNFHTHKSCKPSEEWFAECTREL